MPPRPSRPFAPVPFDGGRYLLLEEIGRGGTGAVYRARDSLRDPRPVCIKRLMQPLGPEAAARWRVEARRLSVVRHANLVGVLGVGEEDLGPYLVLELVDGVDLRQLVRGLARLSGAASGSPCLADPLAVHVACAILRGLGVLARALPGFVHQDITPHNVLVSSEGEIKLTDFGLALASGHSGTKGPRVAGKAGYMAPEQLRGEALDARADLFAVGVILYELLAGVRPGQASRGLVEELRVLLRGDIEPLARHRPHLHTDLQRVVGRLLAARPEQRFDSADVALQALAPHGAGEIGALRLAALVRAWRAAARPHDENAVEAPSPATIARSDVDDA